MSQVRSTHVSRSVGTLFAALCSLVVIAARALSDSQTATTVDNSDSIAVELFENGLNSIVYG